MSTEYVVLDKDGLQVFLNERASEFHLMLAAADERDTRHIAAWKPEGGHMPTAGAYTVP